MKLVYDGSLLYCVAKETLLSVTAEWITQMFL